MSQVSTDPIADMLTRIRNAIAVNKTEIYLPHSMTKEAITKILVQSKYLVSSKVENDEQKNKILKLVLSNEGQNSSITAIERISKPGRRSYTSYKNMPVIKQGRGMVVVSTSKGLMTGEDAKLQKLGGELMLRIY